MLNVHDIERTDTKPVSGKFSLFRYLDSTEQPQAKQVQTSPTIKRMSATIRRTTPIMNLLKEETQLYAHLQPLQLYRLKKESQTQRLSAHGFDVWYFSSTQAHIMHLQNGLGEDGHILMKMISVFATGNQTLRLSIGLSSLLLNLY